MTQPRVIPARRGISVLPWIIGLCIMLVLLGVVGWLQVSASRATLERAYTQRRADLIANSALDEACARVEAQVPAFPNPRPGVNRDLGVFLKGPSAISAATTRARLQDPRVLLSDVYMNSSPWRLEMKAYSGGMYQIRECGILQFSVRVRIRTGTGTVEKSVIVRRYAAVTPALGSPQGQIHIQNANLIRKVIE